MTAHQWLTIAAQAAAIIGFIIVWLKYGRRIAEWEGRQVNRAKRRIRKRLKKLLETTPTDPADGREVWANERNNKPEEETDQ